MLANYYFKTQRWTWSITYGYLLRNLMTNTVGLSYGYILKQQFDLFVGSFFAYKILCIKFNEIIYYQKNESNFSS